MTKFFSLLFVNILLCSSVVIATFFGYIIPLFINDASHVSYLILIIMFTNIILLHYSILSNSNFFMKWLRFNYNRLLFIGVLGTVIGMSVLVNSLGANADISHFFEVMKLGLKTLFNTTAMGVVCFLWSDLNLWISGASDEE